MSLLRGKIVKEHSKTILGFFYLFAYFLFTTTELGVDYHLKLNVEIASRFDKRLIISILENEKILGKSQNLRIFSVFFTKIKKISIKNPPLLDFVN